MSFQGLWGKAFISKDDLSGAIQAELDHPNSWLVAGVSLRKQERNGDYMNFRGDHFFRKMPDKVLEDLLSCALITDFMSDGALDAEFPLPGHIRFVGEGMDRAWEERRGRPSTKGSFPFSRAQFTVNASSMISWAEQHRPDMISRMRGEVLTVGEPFGQERTFERPASFEQSCENDQM